MTGGAWRFVEAEESHDVSLSADARYKLTGEAAGRQIWHQQDQGQGQDRQPQSRASAEKTFRFNAAENPNSSDQVFRAQMLRRWAASGGEVPDADSTPASARDAAIKGLQFYQMLQCDDGHWAGDYGGMN
jgi:lanosterol synthase